MLDLGKLEQDFAVPFEILSRNSLLLVGLFHRPYLLTALGELDFCLSRALVELNIGHPNVNFMLQLILQLIRAYLRPLKVVHTRSRQQSMLGETSRVSL